MSPVLDAFLKGQQSQQSLLEQAQQLVQQKKDMELRQKAQEDLMTRFQAENAISQKQLDLSVQMHKLTQQKDMFDAEQKVREGLQSGAIPIQNHEETGQMPALAPNQMQIPGMMAGYQSGPTPLQVPNPTQTVDTGMGPITVGTPKTDKQLALEQAESLAPITRETKRQEQLGQLKIEQDKSKAAYEKAIDEANIRGEYGLENTRLRNELDSLKIQMSLHDRIMQGGYTTFTPEEMKQQAIDRMRAVGLGNDKWGNSQIDKDAKAIADHIGWNTNLPPGFTTKVFTDAASNATSFLNNFDNFTATLIPPKTITGRMANALSEKYGIQGLSSYKSQFDMFRMNELPRLDIALGLTPGVLGRAPKLLDKLETMAGMPGDSKEVLNVKKYNGVDMFLSAAARQLSILPPSQRIEYWNKIIDDNPNLYEGNKVIHEKLLKAKTTGIYQPNSLLTSWLSSVGVKY